jgi:FkbM family methyltransferase
MGLVRNSIKGYRNGWPLSEAFWYFVRGVSRDLHIAPLIFESIYMGYRKHRIGSKQRSYEKYEKEELSSFKSLWLKSVNGESYFDFGMCCLPDVSGSAGYLKALKQVFEDTYMFPCFLGDNYDSYVVRYFDAKMSDGPYGYTEGGFDVTVKRGDIVIDAGAWIGDFSAYALSKGALSYAFEPIRETFSLLEKTKELNIKLRKANGGGEIVPVCSGLSDRVGEFSMSLGAMNGGIGNSLVMENGVESERISVTTLDTFVSEHGLPRVDFIKADIEGSERDLLRGASRVLRDFAPKLVICTYHLPDDPEVLEQIIKESNPAYEVVHLRHKLFACVTK